MDMRDEPADSKAIPFVWHSFDLRAELPGDWQAEVVKVARTHARHRELMPTSVTSREASHDLRIPVATVGGIQGRVARGDLTPGLPRNGA